MRKKVMRQPRMVPERALARNDLTSAAACKEVSLKYISGTRKSRWQTRTI